MTSSDTRTEGIGVNSMTTKFRSKAYFDWLCSLVMFPDNDKTYLGLMQMMHDKEFVWTVGNDDNRIQDGRDLRQYYLYMSKVLDEQHPTLTRTLTHIEAVSVLEVLIGLSSRVAFLMDSDPRFWAWKLIENLRLHKMNDPIDRYKEETINEILDTLIWRTYEYDGSGGFFPLASPDRDQTLIEIWYQMCAYVSEISNI
jgi:hypothetical protein